jgi:hypothetical protein
VKEAHKRNRNPKYKQKYRVTNWPEYDRSLRNRGDITLWFSEDAIQAWAPMHNGKQGRPQKFSDLAIETVLTLRLVFHLPLRQAEGFVHPWRRPLVVRDKAAAWVEKTAHHGG